jgi:hypothetical protein
MPPRNVRYNAEIERSGEDPETMNYLTVIQATQLVREMVEGDAVVFNAVAGPSAGEI